LFYLAVMAKPLRLRQEKLAQADGRPRLAQAAGAQQRKQPAGGVRQRRHEPIQFGAAEVGPLRRGLVRLGGLLVAAGQRLQEPAGPVSTRSTTAGSGG
jgi:hypothetical protein